MNPTVGEGSSETLSPKPSLIPSGSPTVPVSSKFLTHSQAPTTDQTANIGINFALRLQKNPLNATVAVEKLSKAFPKIRKAKLFGSSEKDLEDARALLKLAIPQDKVYASSNLLPTGVTSALINEFTDTVIRPLLNDGATITVAIGNEPFAEWHNTPGDILVDAYNNVRDGLISAKLKDRVKITIPFHMGIIQDTYPPHDAVFKEKYYKAIESIIHSIYEDNDQLVMNIYPYFPFKSNPADISLEYALGISSSGHDYGSLFEAMYDAVKYAVQKVEPNFKEENIIVGEVGWPTEEVVYDSTYRFQHANVKNAEIFVNNVLKTGIPVYLFEAFDEQNKSGDSGAGEQYSNVENHWGIFYENGDLKYNIPSLEGPK